ncbi:hypothetical protein ABZ953_00735 [Streptomyces sp. NPDC046465]|uniref:hypothetical protein n=1 Tax=Streptomyces sp. NPDC046465 TaxID=3155810 RepID=UPI0033D5B4FA
MTVATPRVCRPCGQVITGPADGVLVRVEPSISGPPRPVYAHLDHANLAGPDAARLRLLADVLARKLDALGGAGGE